MYVIFPAEGRLSETGPVGNFGMSVTPPSFSVQVEAKSTELGASGEIPQIKTAQDKGSHRKKTCDIKIPSGSGDLDLW